MDSALPALQSNQMLQTEVRGLGDGGEKGGNPTDHLYNSPYMFWIFSGSCMIGSSWVVAWKLHDSVEVHATVKDPALKIVQQSVLIF